MRHPITTTLRLAAIALLLGIGGPACGQSDCYHQRRTAGIAAFNQKKYDQALRHFASAENCPIPPPKTNDLDERIDQCRRARNAAIAARRAQQATAARREMRVLYTRWKSTCQDGFRGSEFSVCVATVGMRNIPIEVACTLRPSQGGATLPVRRTCRATTDEEDLDLTFFIPFNDVDWNGNYDR